MGVESGKHSEILSENVFWHPRDFWGTKKDIGENEGALLGIGKRGNIRRLIEEVWVDSTGVKIHTYGNVFFHKFQITAAEGYVVVYSNPSEGDYRCPISETEQQILDKYTQEAGHGLWIDKLKRCLSWWEKYLKS